MQNKESNYGTRGFKKSEQCGAFFEIVRQEVEQSKCSRRRRREQEVPDWRASILLGANSLIIIYKISFTFTKSVLFFTMRKKLLFFRCLNSCFVLSTQVLMRGFIEGV